LDKRSLALTLVRSLTPAEREALRGLAAGESLAGLARRLSIGLADAAAIKRSMKLKLAVVRDADAVRMALYAEWQD
jgi:DNA-binding CsgD family transcriptional regulator